MMANKCYKGKVKWNFDGFWTSYNLPKKLAVVYWGRKTNWGKNFQRLGF
jgi:hypothetical protein